ncbi:MAG: creatininase family protein [Roseiflexaceae bacterium]
MAHYLEQLTWVEAEALLTPETVVVIPLGAASKEHGPHLPLNTDARLATYLTEQIAVQVPVVITPLVNLHFYPAFVEYPGSITLRQETARDLIIDICTSLAAFGPHRFYVLNTGVSTVRALLPAQELLASAGIELRYTDLLQVLSPIEAQVAEQAGGTHADEIETSMMLAIAPDVVDMSKAVDDYHPGVSPLTRTSGGPQTYSASGIFGNATLATRAKGEFVLQHLIAAIVAEIQSFLPAKNRL